MQVSVQILRHCPFPSRERGTAPFRPESLVWQPQVRRTWGWFPSRGCFRAYLPATSIIPKAPLRYALRLPHTGQDIFTHTNAGRSIQNSGANARIHGIDTSLLGLNFLCHLSVHRSSRRTLSTLLSTNPMLVAFLCRSRQKRPMKYPLP